MVICFDGTWNKPADEKLPEDKRVETNVSRFYESVAASDRAGVQQLKWYDEGVGTNWYDRFIGGTIGVGLDLNIIQGYEFLAKHYEAGDDIYILGFSRGAYTARSLVGMIRNCGLVRNEMLGIRVPMAYGIYRTRDDGPDSETAKRFKSMYSRDTPMKFIGVWDTVGALGIPGSVLSGFNSRFFEFHDTRLSAIVENAFQAIAVDEYRLDFDVCLWNPAQAAAGQTLEQRWFLGAHCDVGGGYPDRRLSDVTLRWMQDKAANLGLALATIDVGPDNYKGAMTDSYAQFVNGLYARKHARHYRSIGTAQFGNEVVDESVQKRRKEDREYEPQNNGLPKV
jgi:uncharacterized protein (DUF2235 family)